MKNTLLSIPDQCPSCLSFIKPSMIVDHMTSSFGLEVIFECPRDKCGRYFLGHYGSHDMGSTWWLHSHAKLPEYTSDSSALAVFDIVSQDFSGIYRQSVVAHDGGLDLVAGCGYRKALEFLVKDYLVWSKKSDQSVVEKIFLGAAVNLLPDGSFKTILKRATWLGNDEVHYVKKWGMHADDLKNLIEFAMSVVRAELKAKELEETMPE